MSCRNKVYDEDGNIRCNCGDDGERCEECYAADAAYFRAQFDAATTQERDPQQYEQDMRDAGRGHLVRE